MNSRSLPLRRRYSCRLSKTIQHFYTWRAASMGRARVSQHFDLLAFPNNAVWMHKTLLPRPNSLIFILSSPLSSAPYLSTASSSRSMAADSHCPCLLTLLWLWVRGWPNDRFASRADKNEGADSTFVAGTKKRVPISFLSILRKWWPCLIAKLNRGA